MVSELVQNRPGYTVRRRFVSEMNNAVYLLTAKTSGEQILIDAADDVEALKELLADGAKDARGAALAGGASAGGAWAGADLADAITTDPTPGLRLILTTHAHWDHTRATAELAADTGAQVLIGRGDAEQLRSERDLTADRELDGGERISVVGIELEVFALRGHTTGSLAFASSDGLPALLFTGDSLFPGGVGNTGNDPSRFSQLFSDVSERIFERFGDDTFVYPGHGAETTLGAERPSLQEWQSRGW